MCENKFHGVYTDEDSKRDGYPAFEINVQAFFDKMIAGGHKLFTTNAPDLNEIFLANIPEYARQHYTCHACRQFFQRFGALVTIDSDGNKRVVMWDETNVPAFFEPAVAAMKEAVLASEVNGVFIPDARVLGTPKTGEWTHVHVRLPQGMVNKNILKTSHQVMAAKREDYRVLARVASVHSVQTVEQVIELLKSESVYRGERYVPHAEWFRDVLAKRETLTGENRQNFLWLKAIEAPAGFIPSNSSNVGQTLTDIGNGMSLEEVGRQLASRLNPATFQRAQVAPTVNARREAERTMEKLAEAGIATAESLQRKYASIDEVPLNIWKGSNVQIPEVKTGGIFGNVPTKETTPTVEDVASLPSTVMTWAKFQRTVLPDAQGLEVLVDNPSRFMALVTAAHPDAPNILNWDNTTSWYYHGGIDGEIKRRVEEFGGRHENNEIRASLAWEGLTDLDLHCVTPRGEHIMFNHKRGYCGGYLDLDMNGLDQKSTKPVENLRWASNAPEGRYKIFVHNYSERVNRYTGTPFTLELEIEGKVYTHHGRPLGNQEQTVVFEFDFKRGQAPRFVGTQNHSVSDAWGTPQNSFVKVNGITDSPNLWGEKKAPQSGEHVFFLLDGVKDEQEGKGRGFFTEMLIPELREIRKTLEFFTASTPIQGADEATACGVGYTKDNEWNLTLRVKTKTSSRIIKIDRWD